MASNLNISLKKKTVTSKLIIKGWVRKAKGTLQVFWERGWIDEEQIHKYQLDTVNDNGERDEEYSLVALTSSCLDFSRVRGHGN